MVIAIALCTFCLLRVGPDTLRFILITRTKNSAEQSIHSCFVEQNISSLFYFIKTITLPTALLCMYFQHLYSGETAMLICSCQCG